MRKFILGMWGITIPLIGEEIQILEGESGQRVAVRLWLKFVLSWGLLFGPMLLLKVVSVQCLRAALAMFAALFAVSPIFTGLDLFLFYALPGMRADEDCFWVKSSGSANYRSYSYRDVVQVRQITISKGSRSRYKVEVVFSDGSRWCTARRPHAGIPFLVSLTNEITKRCECPVSPVFAIAEVSST